MCCTCSQALRDLNGELMATYGYDLYSIREYEGTGIDLSQSRTSPPRLALPERLAMLSGEARHVHLQHPDSQADGQSMPMHNMYNSMSSVPSQNQLALPLFAPASQPHQPLTLLYSVLPTPQLQTQPQITFPNFHLQPLPQPQLQQQQVSPTQQASPLVSNSQ